MNLEGFNLTMDNWITALDGYSYLQLCSKPLPASWSVGQVYVHLIEETKFYFEQIEICVVTNDHSEQNPTEEGESMLRNNSFPDQMLEGGPANAHIQQPVSKEELMISFKNLKDEMNRMAALIAATEFKGKTRHPGLGYFSAAQWFQFAEMHFRHHLRQKERIDDFLKANKISVGEI
jgi:hypothetical protein